MKKLLKICKKVLKFSKIYKQVPGAGPTGQTPLGQPDPARSGAVRPTDRPFLLPPLPSAPATPRSPASSPACLGRSRPSPPPRLLATESPPSPLQTYPSDLFLTLVLHRTQPNPKLGFREGVRASTTVLRRELELDEELLLAVAWALRRNRPAWRFPRSPVRRCRRLWLR
jgi:hypothetical protein